MAAPLLRQVLALARGATFTVFLPLVLSTQAESPAPPHPETLNLKNRQVIVVDDEVDSLELVKVILEEEGANVSIFSSSNQKHYRRSANFRLTC